MTNYDSQHSDSKMVAKTQQEEVDRNYEAFKKMLPELIDSDEGRFALLHNAELVACFDTTRDAQLVGSKLLKGKPYSVQKITIKPVDLGWFSRFSHSLDNLMA